MQVLLTPTKSCNIIHNPLQQNPYSNADTLYVIFFFFPECCSPTKISLAPSGLQVLCAYAYMIPGFMFAQ